MAGLPIVQSAEAQYEYSYEYSYRRRVFIIRRQDSARPGRDEQAMGGCAGPGLGCSATATRQSPTCLLFDDPRSQRASQRHLTPCGCIQTFERGTGSKFRSWGHAADRNNAETHASATQQFSRILSPHCLIASELIA